MAKVTAPLLSFGATGQIGKSMIISKWRGIAYAKAYASPANPRTTAQQANRARFTFFGAVWTSLPASVRDAWNAFATGRPFTGSNQFTGQNVSLNAKATDLESQLFSPGAAGGLPAVNVTAATGANAGEVDVTVQVIAALPAGWQIDAVHAAALRNVDPTTIFDGDVAAGSQADPADDIVLGGFTTGDDIAAFGWVEYTKPNGQKAYSVSLSDTAVAA